MEKEEETKKKKWPFIVRVIAWVLFACVLPVVFIGWRFEIFEKAGSLQISGWGMIAIIIIAVTIYAIIKYIRAGFIGWSWVKQIINGVVKVILPLGALLAICISMRNNLNCFIQALSVTLVCEVVGIIVNPFPKWVWEQSQGHFESTVDFIADKFYNKSKEKEKESE